MLGISNLALNLCSGQQLQAGMSNSMGAEGDSGAAQGVDLAPGKTRPCFEELRGGANVLCREEDSCGVSVFGQQRRGVVQHIRISIIECNDHIFSRRRWLVQPANCIP